jgi:hypothetical protein
LINFSQRRCHASRKSGSHLRNKGTWRGCETDNLKTIKTSTHYENRRKFKATQEIVGENRKFQTYPELIRFLFQNFNEISNFQKKNIVDFKGYKSKLDSTISTFKQQINVVTDAMKNFTIKSVKNSEERIKGIMSNYDDRIVEIRSEASVNSENLKKEY